MKITDAELRNISDFINLLNSKKDRIVVVEGKRDSAALRKLGFSGVISEFHSFKGLAQFVDSFGSKRIILLLDFDRKGKYLTSRIVSQLEHRSKIDLSFKKKLATITKGKIRHIEDLSRYEL